MSIDASAVARVLGIDVAFRDLRGGAVLNLPQRVAVLAQGSSDAVFATTKFQATSAGQVGARLGFGSPAHLIARQLFPANGDGVGTVPVTFFPLEDDDSGVAASGTITPSGTQSVAAAYRAKVNNIRSERFVIPAGASVSAICALLEAAITAVLEMPVKASFTYGTPIATKTTTVGTSNGTCTALSVTGAPQVGNYVLECTTAVANGGVWRLTAPDGTVVSTSVTMTPAPGGATVINVGGLQFTLTDGAEDFDVGDVFTIAVSATNVVVTSKWKGESANDLYVEIEGEDLGVTFAIVQPTGGLVDPDVDGALAQFGNVWETMVLNALPISNTDALDAIKDVGEGRWGQTVRKPFVAFVGNTIADPTDASAVASARRDDRINAQLVAPGSKDLPFVVAARELARIVRVANNNPPTDYGSQRATGITPGADGEQWDYVQRDYAVKRGSSTIEVRDGVVCLGDVVTFWRPTGEEPPAYRYVCDIVKLQNILFNIDLIFARPEWDGAPLIPDSDPTVNANARKPKSAVAAVNAKLDALGLAAIISDPKTAKASTVAAIDSQNPKRLNVQTTVQLSGNANVISVDVFFGFFFGTAAVAA